MATGKAGGLDSLRVVLSGMSVCRAKAALYQRERAPRLNNQTKQRLSKKMLIRSIIAISFMVVSYPSLSQPSFFGDFESGTVTGVGNHNWVSIQAAAPDRISLIKDGRGTYARVEIRKGDHPLHCPDCSERSELVIMQDAHGNPLYENLSSGTQRYTFSVKFDPSWRTIMEIIMVLGAYFYSCMAPII